MSDIALTVSVLALVAGGGGLGGEHSTAAFWH